MREFEKLLKLSSLSVAEKKSVGNFIKGLTPNRLHIIDIMTKTIAEVEYKKFTERLTESISTAIIASLLLNTNLSLVEIKKSLDETWDLLNEDSEVINKFKNQYGGDIDMAKKKIEQYQEQIAEKCEKLLKNGLRNQRQAVQMLKTHFPELSPAMLGTAWGECKDKYLNQIEENEEAEIKFENQEEKEAVEEIMKIIEGEEKVEMVKKIETETKVESKLKIKKMVVEGENGVELKRDGGIIAFDNEGQLDEWILEFKQVFAMRKAN
ncbi:hypothetical protein CPJCM30710_25420 [Clostridium polyendosporum]|uniref:Uncharacterized protein n=1 Tax=Clostridium polyendosporum TaxID=69208 RepID=A0A919S202_9CLOT|nr:hypothetical protein [Clostridium polyendosporum]GIM29876.1 hypothetical protein CPJCM30710_25420 [Clostridium polyendosporum]